MLSIAWDVFDCLRKKNARRRRPFFSLPVSKSRNYKERQVDRKKRKVFVTAHVVLRTAAMFLASALNRGRHPRKYWK